MAACFDANRERFSTDVLKFGKRCHLLVSRRLACIESSTESFFALFTCNHQPLSLFQRRLPLLSLRLTRPEVCF